MTAQQCFLWETDATNNFLIRVNRGTGRLAGSMQQISWVQNVMILCRLNARCSTVGDMFFPTEYLCQDSSCSGQVEYGMFGS